MGEEGQVRREVPQGERFVQATGVTGALAGHVKDYRQDLQEAVAGRRTGFDPRFLHRRWLQKLSIEVQVPNANLVATCKPYSDAYHTRSATRNAGALALRVMVVRQSLMGSHPRSVIRSVQAVMGNKKRAVSALHQELETFGEL
jgi:hypothetical protein